MSKNIPSRGRSNERYLSEPFLPDSLNSPTSLPLPLGRGVSDAKHNGYSDLRWDPRAGFSRYHPVNHARTDRAQTSGSNTSDSSVRSICARLTVIMSDDYLDLFLFKGLFLSVVTHRGSFRSQGYRSNWAYSEASTTEIFCVLSILAS